MAEILMSGATEILKKLVGGFSIALSWDVKDDLKKLQSTSEMILAVIADAEKRQEKEELIRLLLRRLKEIAYDIDDVMDEFSYEDLHREDRLKHKVINLPSSSKPSLAFRIKMGKKIKHINKRFDQITQDMYRFQLEFTTPISDGESTEQLDRQDTSHVNESEIVGRENDESQIIKRLTTHTKSSSSSSTPSFSNQYPEKVSVVSIVGMGGLGKTALAQLVFNDQWVKKDFELKMWVHVSEVFDIEIILVNIMESITNTKFHKPSNFRVLVNNVLDILNGKKYLLVLDDLWNEDSEQWGCLMSVLLAGAPGSKVLITTRNEQVASVVRGSIPPYNLNQLEDEACWSIIKRRAFSPGGALNAPKMSDIGKQIAKKCCGLPLAAKFLGGLMRLKNKESDWISIRDDDIWNTPDSKKRILPVLKLSYNYLPSHLKQCFSYCSIFPKNWEISKETLVHLWMAEGFLKQSDVRKYKRAIEDFGRDYFESLAWRSFFQDFKKNDIGDIVTCKMHDLVHDLAKDVLGENELVSLKVSELKDVSEVRRLRLELDEDLSAKFLKSSSNLMKLRTLFIPESLNLNPSIFSEENHLRVLYMTHSQSPSFSKLSSLSFKLRHLRYLHLSYLDLMEVETDQSINKLYNLETLVLTRIVCAQLQNLLSNIQSLKKLRYLEVSWSYMTEIPHSVTSLSNLQTLDLNNCFLIVIPDSIYGLKSLRFLNLSVNPFEELPVSLVTLTNLETLDVSSCKNLKSLPESVAGLANLRIFDFKNCPLLRSLPEDIGSLTQLRYLSLEGTAIEVFPESSANLSNLEYLNLNQCEVPKDVANWTKLRQFYYLRGGPISGLGKLACLEFLTYTVPEKVAINEAECNVGIEELANLYLLETLFISNLRNVKDPVDAQSANLKGKQNLRFLGLSWDEIEYDSEVLEALQLLLDGLDGGMKLEDLGMRCNQTQTSCNHLQAFESLQPPSGLRDLGIANYLGEDLPKWMCVPSCLPNLVNLKLLNCREMKQMPASIGQLPRLRILTLKGLSLKSLDIGASLLRLGLTDLVLLEELRYSSPPSLQILEIDGCKSLTEIPSLPCLTGLEIQKVSPKLVWSVGRSRITSLTDLLLEKIEDLVYFPISILQKNCNLQRLQILKCNQFQGFGVNDNENENVVAPLLLPDLCSVSLQTFQLIDCPDLKFLPDLRGWTSLQKLAIFNCPQVKDSLTYDLKSLSFLKQLGVDFIQRDEHRGDPSSLKDLINLMKK